MCQQKKCPECGEYTVYYDSHFKAYCCSRFSCTYFRRDGESSAPSIQGSYGLDAHGLTVRVAPVLTRASGGFHRAALG